MSSEVVSPSKLQYSRDFLLRFSSIQKDEPTITEKLIPVLSPPQLPGKQTKRVLPKSPRYSGDAAYYRPNANSKTPNPRTKGGISPVYAQKENIPSQTNARSSVESLATPVRKGALAPRSSRTTQKSPNFRKNMTSTWEVASSTDSVKHEALNNFETKSSTSVTSEGTSNAVQNFQIHVSNPVPTPDAKAFDTPIHSPSAATPISRATLSNAKEDMTSPKAFRNSLEPATPGFGERNHHLSPKSPAPTTPFKSPNTPGGSKYSPNKSPKSPIRPISPLDEQRLAQRQKQIDYGYRTVGYLRYRLLVAKDHRKPEHPRTPKKTQGCSKRSWDGQLKKWRRDLHLWDPDNADAFKALLNSDLVVSIIAANPELAEIVDIVREKMDNPSAFAEDLDDINPPDMDSESTQHVDSTHDGVIEKKVSPPRLGNDTKVQKVARTLVF
jgi:hypothetical protein